MTLRADRLRSLFHYDCSSGKFKRIAVVKGARVGSVAGHLKGNGYIHFSIDGKKYGAHRLAWLYMTGELPNGDIDHIDGNRANNAFANLRCVDRSTNLENIRGAKSHNKSSGLLGAYRVANSSRWHSKIQVRGRTVSLGCYDTAEQANAAYMRAKYELHAGFVGG
jgi:hypothetical protein